MLETAESFWKLVSKERFLKLKDFPLKMHSMFGNIYVRESKFSMLKQVKSDNRNRMADKILDDTTSTGIDIGTILSGKSQPQASHW